MRKNIHPINRWVIFQDINSDFKILTRSTIATKEEATWHDGKSYPLYKIDISSSSHPFYTGKQIFIDSRGKVEKFMKKFNIKKPGA